MICYGDGQEAPFAQGKEGSEVGLFSMQLHPEHGPARAARRVETVSVRLRLAARAAVRNTRSEVGAALREAKLAAIAATNDARVVGILLVLAALALGLEMAASFHLL
ncbi:MAG TPA: hypothetical protein VIJ03_08075 [Candidatus Dormibacteraeota bacterium]